ncbi:hypothetical protein K438DRAFT_1883621 [Mycena galopus ATCC 62051]|nr:hypothetical protein K438DRAFT_1883621 [Mycena galopus ATCC 62051]
MRIRLVFSALSVAYALAQSSVNPEAYEVRSDLSCPRPFPRIRLPYFPRPLLLPPSSRPPRLPHLTRLLRLTHSPLVGFTPSLRSVRGIHYLGDFTLLVYGFRFQWFQWPHNRRRSGREHRRVPRRPRRRALLHARSFQRKNAPHAHRRRRERRGDRPALHRPRARGVDAARAARPPGGTPGLWPPRDDVVHKRKGRRGAGREGREGPPTNIR